MFPGEGDRHSLYDFLDLDPHNDEPGEYSERGAALMRLSTRLLNNLRNWLAQHRGEAIDWFAHHREGAPEQRHKEGSFEEAKEEARKRRHDERRFEDLYSTVSLTAAFKALPPDKPLLPEKQDTILPFEAVAFYTRSGNIRYFNLPILAAALAEALREDRCHHYTDREIARIIEEKLGVSRATQSRWFSRMEKVGMTWRRFSAAQLEYVAFGKKRGRESDT